MSLKDNKHNKTTTQMTMP